MQSQLSLPAPHKKEKRKYTKKSEVWLHKKNPKNVEHVAKHVAKPVSTPLVSKSVKKMEKEKEKPDLDSLTCEPLVKLTELEEAFYHCKCDFCLYARKKGFRHAPLKTLLEKDSLYVARKRVESSSSLDETSEVKFQDIDFSFFDVIPTPPASNPADLG